MQCNHRLGIDGCCRRCGRITCWIITTTMTIVGNILAYKLYKVSDLRWICTALHSSLSRIGRCLHSMGLLALLLVLVLCLHLITVANVCYGIRLLIVWSEWQHRHYHHHKWPTGCCLHLTMVLMVFDFQTYSICTWYRTWVRMLVRWCRLFRSNCCQNTCNMIRTSITPTSTWWESCRLFWPTEWPISKFCPSVDPEFFSYKPHIRLASKTFFQSNVVFFDKLWS